MPQVELGRAVMRFRVVLQGDPSLPRRIVEHQLVVGPAAALAVAHRLRLETRQHRRMRVAAALAREPGRRIAGCGARALRDAVVGGVRLPTAVVQGADHDGPVDVAVEEVDQHFLADARDHVAAPVRARERSCQPHPGAGAVIGGRAGVPLRRRMVHAAVAGRAALPVELHLDAVIAVRVDDRARRADHDRGLLPAHRRTRMHDGAAAILRAVAIRPACGDGVDPVAVQGPVSLDAARRPQAGFARRRQRHLSLPQQFVHAGEQVGAQVVVHQVDGAGDGEGPPVVMVRAVAERVAV